MHVLRRRVSWRVLLRPLCVCEPALGTENFIGMRSQIREQHVVDGKSQERSIEFVEPRAGAVVHAVKQCFYFSAGIGHCPIRKDASCGREYLSSLRKADGVEGHEYLPSDPSSAIQKKLTMPAIANFTRVDQRERNCVFRSREAKATQPLLGARRPIPCQGGHRFYGGRAVEHTDEVVVRDAHHL